MPRIRILSSPINGPIPLSVNGQRFVIPRDGACELPDQFLAMLANSQHEFEIVGDDEAAAPEAAETGGAPGGVSGEPPVEPPAPVPAPKVRKKSNLKKA